MSGLFHRSVFTHSFADFHGLRDTQSKTYPDHRFTPDLANMMGDVGLIRPRYGVELYKNTTSVFTGVWTDGVNRVLCVGEDVYLESLP